MGNGKLDRNKEGAEIDGKGQEGTGREGAGRRKGKMASPRIQITEIITIIMTGRTN